MINSTLTTATYFRRENEEICKMLLNKKIETSKFKLEERKVDLGKSSPNEAKEYYIDVLEEMDGKDTISDTLMDFTSNNKVKIVDLLNLVYDSKTDLVIYTKWKPEEDTKLVVKLYHDDIKGNETIDIFELSLPENYENLLELSVEAAVIVTHLVYKMAKSV